MLEASPDIWMHHMRNGDFEEAWKHSDEVLQSRAGKSCWHLPRHFQYCWNGESLAGKKVLVRCYHGLGDTIQFIRYVPLLKEVASEVIVWAQPDLLPLLKSMPEIDQLLPLHDGTPKVSYDADIEVMELPHIFRSTLDTIPVKTPYLHVDSLPKASPKEKLSVGLVWKAGDWDERRSIPFSLLAPLNPIQETNIYIVQADAPAAGWQKGFGIYQGNLPLYDYARFIRNLDLMISVDSMPAHLAGALGIPVWNLLHAEADWRWLANRCDCPWYPSMKLFRQQKTGDWQPVISQVKTELEALAKSRNTSLK